MKLAIVSAAVLILSITGNIYQYGDRTELKSEVDQISQANDKWENHLKLKQQEVDGMAFQCKILSDEIERQSAENAKLKEESDNAKRLLREKDIVGNFDRWIETDPSDFRHSATTASNRVLADIIKISSGNRSANSDTGAKEDILPVVNDAKNPGN